MTQKDIAKSKLDRELKVAIATGDSVVIQCTDAPLRIVVRDGRIVSGLGSIDNVKVIVKLPTARDDED